MSIIQSYLFDNPIDFVLNNTQIESGTAKLGFLDDISQPISETFTTDTGFTYDPLKSQFNAGSLLQVDKRTPNAVFAANFNLGNNSNWNNLVPVVGGTAAVVASKLECLGYTNANFAYVDSSIGNIGSQLTIKCKFTPNYSGTPASNTNIFSLEDPAFPSTKNTVVLMHSASGGSIRHQWGDDTGLIVAVGVSAGLLPAWSPVAGTTYEFEYNLNTQTGEMRLFINGTLFSYKSGMPLATRGTSATRMRIGAGYSYAVSNGTYEDFMLFNNIQHTANYTAGYSFSDYSYQGSKVDLPNFTYTSVGSIQGITNFVTSEIGSPRYIINGYYWNGSAWAASNSSYSQATPKSTLLANISTLPVPTNTVTISVSFPDSDVISSLDSLDMEITGQKYSLTGYIEPATGIYVASILGFLQDSTSPIGTSVGVCLKINGILKYWDGLAWVNSNGTIAQTNTYLEINDNLGSLELSENSDIVPRWVLDSNSDVLTPSVDTASIVYNFGGLDSPADTCLVYGYIKNLSGNPVSGATLTFSLSAAQTSYNEAANNIISTKSVTAKTNVNGFFSLDLIRSSEFEESVQYKVTIDLKDKVVVSKIAGNSILFSVPDLDVQDITSLLPTI